MVVDVDEFQRKEQELKTRQKKDFDRHHGARNLPVLAEGDPVWLPDKETEGMVRREVSPQSYEVTTTDGVYRRNRQDLIELPDHPVANQQDEDNVHQTATQGQPPDTEDQPPDEVETQRRRSLRQSRQPDRFDPSWS